MPQVDFHGVPLARQRFALDLLCQRRVEQQSIPSSVDPEVSFMVSHARPGSVLSRVRVALVVVGVALYTHPVPTQTPAPSSPYSILDLGTLGGASAAGYDVAEFGQFAAGHAKTATNNDHAFALVDGVLKDLGTLGGATSMAYGLYYGAVVGQSQDESGQFHAFLFNLWAGGGGSMIDLGTLGGSGSVAYDVDSSTVVGASQITGNTRLQAFAYSNDKMSALPTNRGGDSVAKAITSGQVVGHACATGSTSCLGFWIKEGAVKYLPSLGGAGRDSFANAINWNEQIVGVSALDDPAEKHAFLYAADSMTDLGTLGGSNSEALDINSAGEIVGAADTASNGTHAFIWRNGVMTDLNTLLPSGTGWILQSANGISEGGQIVGTGTLNGAPRAFLLTPPADVSLWIGGVRSQATSNLPIGVEAGKNIRFVLSVIGTPDPLTIYGARLTDTLTGPAEYVSIRGYDSTAEECEITPKVLTCDVPPIDTIGLGREYLITVRTTAAGPVSHNAVISWDGSDTNSGNNTAAENNRAVSAASLALTPATLPGGKASSVRVTLTDIAPYSNDASVRMTSSRPDIAPVPSTFVVPYPNPTRAFNIVPQVVSTPTTVEITASYGLVTVRQTLTVVPPALSQLYLTPTTVIGGCGTSAGKIVLTGSAPAGGAVVPLPNTNSMATVPASVTVPAGSSTQTFMVPTQYVTSNAFGTVTASYGGVSQTLNLIVRPIRVKTLTLSPNPAKGGATVSGTLTLECASPSNIVVSLTSTRSSVAAPTVTSITIPAGATTGSFSVRTSAVTANETATIYATAYGVRKGTRLTVTP
jgi:probable HAF family extracellular repeat protein